MCVFYFGRLYEQRQIMEKLFMLFGTTLRRRATIPKAKSQLEKDFQLIRAYFGPFKSIGNQNAVDMMYLPKYKKPSQIGR